MPPVSVPATCRSRSGLRPAGARAVHPTLLIDLVFALGYHSVISPCGNGPSREHPPRVDCRSTSPASPCARCPEPPLEAAIAEVVDESGQIVLATQGIPLDGGAVLARDRRERSPLVDRQVARLRRVYSAAIRISAAQQSRTGSVDFICFLLVQALLRTFRFPRRWPDAGKISRIL